MNYDKHVEKIEKMAEEIEIIIEKYYPGITKKNYNNFGFPDEKKGSSARGRITLALSIELMKAGAFSDDETI